MPFPRVKSILNRSERSRRARKNRRSYHVAQNPVRRRTGSRSGAGIMPRIFIPELNKTLICPPGARLLEVLADAGIALEAPCGGRGVCGKCKVRVVSGGKAEDRLACALRPTRDLILELPDGETGHRFLTAGRTPEFVPADAEPGTYGLAVDIGTTTLAAVLVDLANGEERGTRSSLNPQKRHGLDVLSRIAYARQHGPEGVHTLQREIVGALTEMGLSLCAGLGVAPRSVRAVAASANTTMLHLLLGVDPSPMGVAPFAPAFAESRTVRAPEIGLPFEEASLFTLPSVSAFVGADVVAGAWACGMARRPGNALFIDIGTNGEIVLSCGGQLTACSCAAGPALEGMNIRCGMRAAEGVIEKVSISRGGSVRLSVVGNVSPSGICGSGILSALHELLRVGLVQSDGCMLRKSDLEPDDPLRGLCRTEDGQAAVVLAPVEPAPAGRTLPVVVTQKDVRQVQLAKGAILSGVLALLRRAGIGAADLDRVFVAGQFGAHLPVAGLTACGILPDLPADRVEYVGNTSLSGARAALLAPSVRDEMNRLAGEIGYTDLAATEGYDRLFLECLEFPKNNSDFSADAKRQA